MKYDNDKIIVDKWGVPKNSNLIGWALSYKAYSYLVAIANYSKSFSGERARFYLSVCFSVEEKVQCRVGEGSFMSSILQGDFLQAMFNADSTNKAALIKAMGKDEIELPNAEHYYKIEREERERWDKIKVDIED